MHLGHFSHKLGCTHDTVLPKDDSSLNRGLIDFQQISPDSLVRVRALSCTVCCIYIFGANILCTSEKVHFPMMSRKLLHQDNKDITYVYSKRPTKDLHFTCAPFANLTHFYPGPTHRNKYSGMYGLSYIPSYVHTRIQV